MTKVDTYRGILRVTENWDEYLIQESRLPGPRANIELARAAAEEGNAAWFEHLLTYNATKAPVNSPYEFLAFCGVLGQGKLLEEGHGDALATLRNCAADARWRIREAVAMALQRYGRSDMKALLAEMNSWSKGDLLERRAAAAGLCEPGLVKDPKVCGQVIKILDQITESILDNDDRRSDSFRAMRKCLGYCWSVVVASNPQAGEPFMEKWIKSKDPDILWIMKQNLKKKRLQRADPEWTATWDERLAAQARKKA